jgi:alpha-L-fucosidase
MRTPCGPQPLLLTRHRAVRALFTALAIASVALGCSDRGSSADAEPTLCGEVDGASGAPASAHEPAASRPLPAWYDDAKLGVMIHWGVWAVPAWAETTLDPERLADPDDPEYFLAPGGVERFVRHNPYSEWYENSLAIEGTETQAFHHATYGAGFPYTGFAPLFAEASASWVADGWARLFAEARARYVVLVTKHHDGFALWPTSVENPERPGWSAARDYVGELADAVRQRCQRFGVYYSGGIDWSFAPPPIETLLDFLDAAPSSEDYARYVEAHYRELVARYRPSVLWNDIASPRLTDEAALFADYYAAVPDGVVNDRWGLEPGTPPADFRTVEYDVRDEISPDKWEAVRGIGRAFGFNVNQSLADYGTPEKYLHLLIDVASKNGNLLLNVGPMADGTIPAPQVEVLRALGAWLARYGEAIFATRPWSRFAGTTEQALPLRFTHSRAGDVVYAIVLGTPRGDGVTLRDLPLSPRAIRLAGADAGGTGVSLGWRRDGDDLRIELPSPLSELPAHAFALELG